jgi:hypothetical protein
MLGFLNAAILFGLIGVSIPVLIHLLARPRTKQVVFSSLTFLKAVERQKAKRVKMRRWLLLFLRTAAVACLVLAFARPVIRSSRSFLRSRSGGVSAWIVDPSFSMMREGLWSRTQGDASVLTGFMKPDERAALLWTVPSLESETDSLLAGPELFRHVQNRIPSWQRGQTLAALEKAASQLSKKSQPNPEIFLLGDLQATGFTVARDTTALRKWKGTVFVLPAKGGSENVAVTDAGITSSVLKADEPMRILATVRNFGAEPTKDKLIRFFLNNQAVAQKTISLRPGESLTESVPVMQVAAGWLWGKVLSEKDPFLQDDERFFCAFVPKTMRVLVAGKSRSDLSFFKYALQPRPDARSGFDIQIRTSNEDWSPLLGGMDVLFLSNYPRLTGREVQACRSFIENGGGIFCTLGGDVDLMNLNDAFLVPLWGDSLHIGKAQTETSGFLSLGVFDTEHPLFQGVFERGKKPAQSPRFTKAAELSGGPYQMVLPFSNGRPFLAEMRFGKGTLILMASGIQKEWSDLAHSPFFPALIVRSAVYLSASRFGNTGQVSAGDSLAVSLNQDSKPVRYQAELPSGERVFLVPALKQGRLLLTLPQTDAPGLYRFYADSTLVGLFAVNPDPKESDFRPISKEALAKYCPSAAVVFLDAKEPVEKQILSWRIGRELWKGMLALALILLVAESVVGAAWK